MKSIALDQSILFLIPAWVKYFFMVPNFVVSISLLIKHIYTLSMRELFPLSTDHWHRQGAILQIDCHHFFWSITFLISAPNDYEFFFDYHSYMMAAWLECFSIKFYILNSLLFLYVVANFKAHYSQIRGHYLFVIVLAMLALASKYHYFCATSNYSQYGFCRPISLACFLEMISVSNLHSRCLMLDERSKLFIFQSLLLLSKKFRFIFLRGWNSLS